jgi:hypothetical protein
MVPIELSIQHWKRSLSKYIKNEIAFSNWGFELSVIWTK